MAALRAIEALSERLSSGEEPPIEALRAAMAAARVEAEADPAGAPALAAAVGRLIGVVEARQSEVREGLAGAGQGRRAAKGYGGMRSHQRGQRIRIKA